VTAATHAIHILDVFAESPLSGNQLAVVEAAGDLSTDQMQAIALETNFSETTFITGPEQADGGFPVRIFTPAAELPFAGHPTLGTAWLIRNRLLSDRPDEVLLNLGVGQVPVTFEETEGVEVGFLRAPEATLGDIVAAQDVAPSLGLSIADIDDALPAQQVSAGLDFLIVPLRNAAALSKCQPSRDGFEKLASRGIRPFVYAFCPEAMSPENDLGARFFFDANGIREDPATGSATGALGGYLLHNRYSSESDFFLRIEQGVQMGRPSLLRLRGSLGNGAVTVSVGGRVFHTVRGELL